jgi:hypothetical protein
MGILAPLHLNRETPQSLYFSTGWGTLKTSLIFLFFAVAVWVMAFASKPLITNPQFKDPLIQWLPGVLPWLSAGIFLLAFALVGYRKTLLLDREKKNLTLQFSIWGIAYKRWQILFQEIKEWHLNNITPKRYQKELNIKNRPVGYWEIQVTLKRGENIRLDQAPKQAEVSALLETIKFFIDGKNCSV